MSKTYTLTTGESYTLQDFCYCVAHLKRLVRIPGITLERLPTEGYPHKAPRTIARVMSQEIMFDDGAYLQFPSTNRFS